MPCSNTSFPVCLQGKEKREIRRKFTREAVYFQLPFMNDDHLPGPSQTLSYFILLISLWDKTIKTFHWRTLRIRRGLENFKVQSSWLPDSKIINHCIILLLFSKKQMWGGQKLLWLLLSGLVRQLGGGHWKESPSCWLLLIWGNKETRRSSHHVESHLFLLFTLVKSPRSILDLEYLFNKFILSNC